MARALPENFSKIEVQARHLTQAELNYELEIREKEDVFQSDQEARDWLQKRFKTEFLGTYQKPGRGASRILPMEEIQYCDLALKEIRTTINNNPDKEGIETCISRVKHLFDRLSRMVCEPGNEAQAKILLETAESQLLELIVMQEEDECPSEQQVQEKELTTINVDESQIQQIATTGAAPSQTQQNTGAGVIPKPRRRPQFNVADFETPETSMNFPNTQATSHMTQPRMLNPAYMQAMQAAAHIEDCSDEMDPANTVETETRETQAFRTFETRLKELQRKSQVQLIELQRQSQAQMQMLMNEINTMRLQQNANQHTQQQRMSYNSTIDPNSRLLTDPHSSPPLNTFFVQENDQNGNSPLNRMSSQYEQATSQRTQAQALQIHAPALLNQRRINESSDISVEGLLQATTDAHNQQINPSRRQIPRNASEQPQIDAQLDYEISPFRPVPIDKWKCFFSGKRERRQDELGLPDFIKQVEYQTRANKMHPDTVAQQITSLLRSPALEWLTFLPDKPKSWKELVTIMQEKYLSNDYEFEILADIQKRKQKPDESVTEFVSDIQKMYRSLKHPVNERLQCHNIQSNLRLEIAEGMFSQRFDSVTHLEHTARNIERNIQARKPPQQKQKPKFYGKKQNKYSRGINAINTEETTADYETGSEEDQIGSESSEEEPPEVAAIKEVCAVLKAKCAHVLGKAKNGQSENSSQVKNKSFSSKKHNEDNSKFCWNCKQFGHTYKFCKRPEQHVFCHNCGTPGKYANNCEHPHCQAIRTKNGQAGSHTQEK